MVQVRKKTKKKKKSTSDQGKRARNKEQTKKKILEVALKLFKKKGVNGTTTREIAKGAKIAEGTFFNYFRTKDDLALYFLERHAQELVDDVRLDKNLAQASLEEILFTISQRHIDFLQENRELIGTLFFRALQPDSSLHPFSVGTQKINLIYFEFFKEIFDRAHDKGEIQLNNQFLPYAYSMFNLGILIYSIFDRSEEKENSTAFLDRAITLGTSFMKNPEETVRVFSKFKSFKW